MNKKAKTGFYLLWLHLGLVGPLFAWQKDPQVESNKSLAEKFALRALAARNTNADTCIFYAQKAYVMAATTNEAVGKMMANYAMGQAEIVKGRYQSAITYFDQTMAIAKKSRNDSMMGNVFGAIGTSLWQLGKHAEAIENQFKALSIREQVGDRDGMIASKINIGMVYQSQDKTDLAEKYIKEALKDLETYESPRLRISALHMLANIYGMQGKIREALSLDSAGIDLSEKTNNLFSKAMFYDNMGNCYMYADPPDYRKAYDYFQLTIGIDSSFGNKKQMSDSYLNLGHLFIIQKKYTQSIPYLFRSVSLADASGYTQGKKLAYEYLAEAYQKSGNPAQAYTVFKKAVAVKDSLLNIQSEARIAELQTIYETEKKQKQIELQQEQLSKKNYILAGTILIAFLAAMSGYLYYRRYRLKQKNRLQQAIMLQQQLAAKAVMEAEEKERERIARDLHDGVGQMMSAAKMNLSAFESELQIKDGQQKASFEKIISLVDESCKEVRSVSHHMMPNALLKRGLAAAIRDFVEKLDSKVIKVHLVTEGIDQSIDSVIETVLYRVIQESVNNVIKHAGANHLDISIIRDHEGISATIEDNGKGFDLSQGGISEGLGLKNIRTRIEYLKGTVDIDAAPGKGTLVAIHVPLH
ncbi:MAG: tetratricopeptide repeat protein [Terrimonas sp.]|nr:tetratricopeptide repeat protein [Terrimonas sp.]